MSEDVDVITEIIMEQANDFLIADEHTKEDINMLQIGINKVEFIRSKNYL
jgi:hypothetical protein